MTLSEVGFDGGGDERKCVATLLTAGFNHRQHRLDEATAGSTLRPERQFPPDHRMTQRTLASVICRFHPFVIQEHPQPLAMLVQFPTRSTHVAVVALHSAQQQTLHFAANRTHSTHQCGTRNPVGAIVGPMLEQLARGRARRSPSHLERGLPVSIIAWKSRFRCAQHHCRRPTCQYIFARSQVTTPWNLSVKKSPSAVASRVARTANTVNCRATNVQSHALPFSSFVAVSSMFKCSCTGS